MSKRNIWLLVLVALFSCQAKTVPAQDGLKEAQDLLTKKKWVQAREAFDALLEDHGDNFDVRIGMAQACYWGGDFETGGFHAARAQKANKKSALANEFVGRCFLAQGHAKREGGGDPTGLYEQAFDALNSALKSNKKSSDLWLQKGNVSYWLSKNADAAVAYEEAFKLDKKQGGNAHWSANFYVKTNSLTKAGDMYAAALAAGLNKQLEKGSVDGLWACFGKTQSWDELLKRIDIWIKGQPKSGLAHWWKGYVLDRKSDKTAAKAAWKKLASMPGRYQADGFFFQGMAAKALGKEEEAIVCFSEAGKLDNGWNKQKHPGLQLHAIAGAHFANGNYAKACEIGEKYALPALTKVLRCHLLRDLGLFFRDHGGIGMRGQSKAKPVLVKSREFYKLACKEMLAYRELDKGWRAQCYNDYALMFHYYDLKDEESAIKYYKMALELDKTNSDACLNMGRIWMQMGKLDDALRIAQQGVARRDLTALINRIKSQMKK